MCLVPSSPARRIPPSPAIRGVKPTRTFLTPARPSVTAQQDEMAEELDRLICSASYQDLIGLPAREAQLGEACEELACAILHEDSADAASVRHAGSVLSQMLPGLLSCSITLPDAQSTPSTTHVPLAAPAYGCCCATPTTILLPLGPLDSSHVSASAMAAPGCSYCSPQEEEGAGGGCGACGSLRLTFDASPVPAEELEEACHLACHLGSTLRHVAKQELEDVLDILSQHTGEMHLP